MKINELNINSSIIEKWLHDDNWDVRVAAMNARQGRTDISISAIETGLRDGNWRAIVAAIRARQLGTDIPIAIIEKWLQDNSWHVRAAAMNACQGRTDILISVIETGLRDNSWHVRAAAMNACQGRTDIPLAYKRRFNPPEHVYKKCINDVIVEAEIPSDAAVRGRKDCKCRASKAIITKVDGEIFGLNIGVSSYDHSTVYRVGDVIEIDDFDYSDEECSAGFHFFCTKEEAAAYVIL